MPAHKIKKSTSNNEKSFLQYQIRKHFGWKRDEYRHKLNEFAVQLNYPLTEPKKQFALHVLYKIAMICGIHVAKKDAMQKVAFNYELCHLLEKDDLWLPDEAAIERSEKNSHAKDATRRAGSTASPADNVPRSRPASGASMRRPDAVPCSLPTSDPIAVRNALVSAVATLQSLHKQGELCQALFSSFSQEELVACLPMFNVLMGAAAPLTTPISEIEGDSDEGNQGDGYGQVLDALVTGEKKLNAGAAAANENAAPQDDDTEDDADDAMERFLQDLEKNIKQGL